MIKGYRSLAHGHPFLYRRVSNFSALNICCSDFLYRFKMASPAKEDIAVTNFRRYIRVNTEQPNPDYESCRKFLFELGEELGFECNSYECVKGKPMVWLTKYGTDLSKKSLMLYSHTDVVPTFKDKWTYDPYAAVKDDQGRIYGRGTQDMKSVGIQYIEALRRLLKSGNDKFLRTIHIVFGPEEELGGAEGMELFIETDKFRSLNIGFSLDEGIANPEDHFKVYYAERCPWWVKVTCPGSPGHGSRFLENTPGAKLQRVINNFLGWREVQKAYLEAREDTMTLGDITSCNLTKVEGGVQMNVVPDEMSAYFDIRVTPTDDYDELEKKIAGFCKDAGDDVLYSFVQKTMIKNMTPTEKTDPWWNIFSSILERNNLAYKKEIFVGATDSRFLRRAGYKAIGFSPMKNTPTLLHDHDEFLTEDEYLRGVAIYEQLITALANNINGD